MESLGVRREVTRAFPLTVRLLPTPMTAPPSYPVTIRWLAGRRAYGSVQSGFLQPLCVWPTRMPLPSVHHHHLTLGLTPPGLLILIWTLPPASTVPELRLTPPLPSSPTLVNV